MFDKFLLRIRELVRRRQYIVTIHAEEEMSSDNVSIYDVERGILSGKIIERQKEGKSNEWKYLVRGETLSNGDIIIVTKISVTGKLIIITVFLDN